MVIGAFAGAAAGYYSASPWIGFLQRVWRRSAGSAARSGLHHLQGQSDHLGVALNFIGQGLALFLCRLFFDGATMSKPVPKQMPKL